MGYRNYISQMSKREYNKIKSMTPDELVKYYNIEVEEDGYWYMGVYDFGEDLYNFGKYVDFEPPKGSMKHFFKKKEMKERYKDDELFVVTPEFLEYIIENYKKKIESYYNDMMDPFFGKRDDIMDREVPTNFLNSINVEYNYPNNKYKFDFSLITQEEQNALWKILEHIRTMRTEWTILTPYKLKDGRDEITSSWKYEYGIFELVRIYKTFDWKKNVMIYYGY